MPLIKLNATQGLTGTLPAVSGANLTGIASDFVLIKSITANNDATVEFINGSSGAVIDSTYKQYIIKGFNITADANGETYFAFRESSSFQNGTYARIYSRLERTSGGSGQSVGSTWAESSYGLRLEHNYTGQSPKASNFDIIVNNPDDSTLLTSCMFHTWGANQESQDKYMGMRGGAFYKDNGNAVDGFRFDHSGGDLYGTFSLYGVKA